MGAQIVRRDRRTWSLFEDLEPINGIPTKGYLGTYETLKVARRIATFFGHENPEVVRVQDQIREAGL